MKAKVIVDTGPLVALLNRQDKAHTWVMAQLADIRPPMITCEAVLAEATYLTSQIKGAREALIEMVGEGFLQIGLQVQDQHAALLAMVKRYVNVPMSLADACVVRLAEMHPKSPVFTLDSDFNIYRKNGRQVIEQICP
ncbi:MAG: PIN domain-containing protein [Burkholderiales bacterium]|nr:MAG: PIN domain-containing protein [Burkholderiales bacterium]